MLYPFIGNGEDKDKYIILLTTQIMEEPFTNVDKQKDINDEYNPLSKKGDSMLTKIYNGSREISKRDASIMLSHLSKEHFIGYLTNYPPDVIDMISKAMQENGITIIDNDVITTCADLFVSILTDCIKRKTVKETLDAEYKKEESSSFNLERIIENILFNPEDPNLSDVQNDKVMLELYNYAALTSSDDIYDIEKTLIETFKRCVVKYHIDYFIKSDPSKSLDPTLLNLIDDVIIIFEGILEMLKEYEQNDIYDTIIRFKVALDQYKKYLCAKMRPSPSNDNSWIPKNRWKKDKIDRMIISYRSWLATLYNKIYNGEECIII